jgi:Tfp pilus assembly protein PilF
LRLCPARGSTLTTTTLAALILLSSPAPAIDLKRGDPVPPMVLSTADGRTLDTARQTGQILLMVFGETDHPRTLVALQQIDAVLADPQLAQAEILPILVLSKHSRVDRLAPLVEGLEHRITSVHDTSRQAFAACGVVALPSTAIADRQGRIVHAVAGLTPTFADAVLDALLVAAGRLSAEQLEQRLHPPEIDAVADPSVRTVRVIEFARRLARIGMADEARAKFEEALEMAPGSLDARLGLGELLLAEQDLEAARDQFQAALKVDPSSVEAACGLAQVHAGRGAQELQAGLDLVQRLIKQEPGSPRLRYVRGLLHEQRGEMAEAAASFRRAAELLMAQQAADTTAAEESASP